MRIFARFLLAPCFVVLVLGLLLLNGIIQEARIALDARHRRLVRRYFGQLFIHFVQR